MFKVVKQFITAEDVALVQGYIPTIKFHTKNDHVPLHNNLFDGGALFDIHTRGEMPKEILDIFSKYSRGYWELVSEVENEKYHPPMFSKHYIARLSSGASDGYHYADSRPIGTYGSYIVWNDGYAGGSIGFEETNERIQLSPGDLIFFKETQENRHRIEEITSGEMFFSESWMSPWGTCPDPNVKYETVHWEDWEIKGFYE